RAAIDEIADEPELVAIGREVEAREKLAQFLRAPLNISDRVAHRSIENDQRPTRIASTSQGAACSTVSSVRFRKMDGPWRSRLATTMRSDRRSRAARTISALILPVSTLQRSAGMPSSAERACSCLRARAS